MANKNQFKEYKKLLSQWIKFKSISTDAKYKRGVFNAADWFRSLLKNYGFVSKLIKGKTTNP